MLFNLQVPGQRVSHLTPAKAGDCGTPGHPRHEWDGKSKEMSSLLEQQKWHFEVSQVVVKNYFESTHSRPTWISASAASLAVAGAIIGTEMLPDMETSIILSGRTKIHPPFVVSVSEGICGVITTLVQAAPLRWMSSLMLLFSLLSLQ